MKKTTFLLVLLGLFSLAGCDIDDDGSNFHYVALEAVSADFPDSFTLGEVYPIEVTFTVPNACTFFRGFDFNKTDLTERRILTVGSVHEDDVCTQAIEERTATFNFEVLYDQTYNFLIWAGHDENDEDIYLEFEVPVI